MDEQEEQINTELPDSWWYRVYLAVVFTTIIVISILWMFSKYFSK